MVPIARILLSNGGLPTGDNGISIAFNVWRAFSIASPWFRVGRIVATGTKRKLDRAERAAYDAPFPSSEYTAGARVFPSLEYRKHVEKDAALARRFQPVFVSQPTVENTISILRGLKEKYEAHHGVRITDPAIIAAATLSDRYIADRFLPDKAIDLIDEAAARQRMQVDSKPEELDEFDRRI